MKRLDTVLRARVSKQQRERLENLAKEAGMSLGQMLRALIDNAELVSKPTIKATVPIDND